MLATRGGLVMGMCSELCIQTANESFLIGNDIGSSFAALLKEMESVNQWGYATGRGAWGQSVTMAVQHTVC
jgi:hypothetical protein